MLDWQVLQQPGPQPGECKVWLPEVLQMRARELPRGASSASLSFKGQLSITSPPCADLAPFEVALNPI